MVVNHHILDPSRTALLTKEQALCRPAEDVILPILSDLCRSPELAFVFIEQAASLAGAQPRLRYKILLVDARTVRNQFLKFRQA